MQSLRSTMAEKKKDEVDVVGDRESGEFGADFMLEVNSVLDKLKNKLAKSKSQSFLGEENVPDSDELVSLIGRLQSSLGDVLAEQDGDGEQQDIGDAQFASTEANDKEVRDQEENGEEKDDVDVDESSDEEVEGRNNIGLDLQRSESGLYQSSSFGSSAGGSPGVVTAGLQFSVDLNKAKGKVLAVDQTQHGRRITDSGVVLCDDVVGEVDQRQNCRSEARSLLGKAIGRCKSREELVKQLEDECSEVEGQVNSSEELLAFAESPVNIMERNDEEFLKKKDQKDLPWKIRLAKKKLERKPAQDSSIILNKLVAPSSHILQRQQLFKEVTNTSPKPYKAPFFSQSMSLGNVSQMKQTWQSTIQSNQPKYVGFFNRPVYSRSTDAFKPQALNIAKTFSAGTLSPLSPMKPKTPVSAINDSEDSDDDDEGEMFSFKSSLSEGQLSSKQRVMPGKTSDQECYQVTRPSKASMKEKQYEESAKIFPESGLTNFYTASLEPCSDHPTEADHALVLRRPTTLAIKPTVPDCRPDEDAPPLPLRGECPLPPPRPEPITASKGSKLPYAEPSSTLNSLSRSKSTPSASNLAAGDNGSTDMSQGTIKTKEVKETTETARVNTVSQIQSQLEGRMSEKSSSRSISPHGQKFKCTGKSSIADFVKKMDSQVQERSKRSRPKSAIWSDSMTRSDSSAQDWRKELITPGLAAQIPVDDKPTAVKSDALKVAIKKAALKKQTSENAESTRLADASTKPQIRRLHTVSGAQNQDTVFHAPVEGKTFHSLAPLRLETGDGAVPTQEVQESNNGHSEDSTPSLELQEEPLPVFGYMPAEDELQRLAQEEQLHGLEQQKIEEFKQLERAVINKQQQLQQQQELEKQKIKKQKELQWKELEKQAALRKQEELKLEEVRKLEQKQQEEAMKQENARKEAEQKMLAEAKRQEKAKKLEEIKKQEEAKKLEEIKKAEEAKKLQEIKKQEEAKKLQEIKKQEEAKKLEEIKKQEEAKKLEEIKKQEEAKKLQEIKKQEEAKKLEEIKKQEEAKKLEEIKKQEEAKKLEEIKKQEELKKLEEAKRQAKRAEAKKRAEEKAKDEAKIREKAEKEEQTKKNAEQKQKEQTNTDMKLLELKQETKSKEQEKNTIVEDRNLLKRQENLKHQQKQEHQQKYPQSRMTQHKHQQEQQYSDSSQEKSTTTNESRSPPAADQKAVVSCSASFSGDSCDEQSTWQCSMPTESQKHEHSVPAGSSQLVQRAESAAQESTFSSTPVTSPIAHSYTSDNEEKMWRPVSAPFKERPPLSTLRQNSVEAASLVSSLVNRQQSREDLVRRASLSSSERNGSQSSIGTFVNAQDDGYFGDYETEINDDDVFVGDSRQVSGTAASAAKNFQLPFSNVEQQSSAVSSAPVWSRTIKSISNVVPAPEDPKPIPVTKKVETVKTFRQRHASLDGRSSAASRTAFSKCASQSPELPRKVMSFGPVAFAPQVTQSSSKAAAEISSERHPRSQFKKSFENVPPPNAAIHQPIKTKSASVSEVQGKIKAFTPASNTVSACPKPPLKVSAQKWQSAESVSSTKVSGFVVPPLPTTEMRQQQLKEQQMEAMMRNRSKWGTVAAPNRLMGSGVSVAPDSHAAHFQPPSVSRWGSAPDNTVCPQLPTQADRFNKVASASNSRHSSMSSLPSSGTATPPNQLRTSAFGAGGHSSQVTTFSSTTTTSTHVNKGVSPFNKFQQLDAQQHTTRRASGAGGGGGPLFALSSSLKSSANSIKEVLLQWCQCRTRGYQGVKIENFSTSWNDGLAFCALIHHFYPDAFDFDKLDPKNRRQNFDLAFRTADERAGVMALLDVDDMVMMKKPDWKCVFTYIQSLYKRLKDE
ncbi:uncharacterized protein LOC108669362 isoform X1 [Hyalella azteca]|uniref:Uncharacterized protein LOC108669362 isoform X1 n=1 Tax=Hyalella azteca TaxID=294128 RepID=A0A8B7NEY3_HYAAZ|nr:uncharacterized protein LOC108669362 isoform X1 [Hyalella azteca]